MYRSSSRRTVLFLFLAATLFLNPLSAAPLIGPGDAASSLQAGSPAFLHSLWDLVTSLWAGTPPASSAALAVTEVSDPTHFPLQTGSCIDPMGGRPPCKK